MLTAWEGNMGNCLPEKTNVDRGEALKKNMLKNKTIRYLYTQGNWQILSRVVLLFAKWLQVNNDNHTFCVERSILDTQHS